MPTPRVLVLRSPGTNCDEETAHAFRLAGGAPDRVHVNRLLESPALLDDFQILCLPGGFSYGDDIGAGRVLAGQLRHHLAEPLQTFRDADKLVLGICNGFQVLQQTGLLDLEEDDGPMATLTWNNHGRYEARWVHLAVEAGKSVFLEGCTTLELPIAHAEGKIAVRDEAALARLVDEQRVVLRYALPDGTTRDEPLPFPTNPNGAAGNAAALSDKTGRVLGMMPHPERYLDKTQHPRWTRDVRESEPDGLRLFKNGVDYFG